MLFFHQPLLIFVDPWLMSWGSLEMQTQVPPFFSSGVAKSYASLFTSDTPAVLIVKERTFLYLHRSFIFNDFGMLSHDCGRNLSRHH
jgi:hypothetical protein